jgi:CheY-like chemotaxis protein
MPDGEGGQLILCLGTDVTALKRLQHELERARDEAERLAVAKSDFLANMSHEIRTPLNAVLGLAQLALQTPELSDSNRLAFERIHDAGTHLLGVVNDVLDFAKLEADKFTPDLRDTDPAELARAALELVEPRARIKNLPLSLELDPTLPARLPLDPLRVRQVLVNLLGNAVKFTQQGAVRLQVQASPHELTFTVHDTGPGIDAAERERIFQAFEQADSSTTRHFGGTGLGLSISRRLARGMGGDITLYSQPGLGSQFSLRLPLAVAARSPAPAPTVAPRFGPEALKGLRVLIVDDVAINREILGEMLVQLGAQFEQVGSGPEALDWVATRGIATIDLVLMDIQMPGMDGYEATRRLHQAHPELPVLALTANALPEQRAQSAAAGMRGHITKPVELAELVAALREQAQALGLWLAPEGGVPAPAEPLERRARPVAVVAAPAPRALADWDFEAALTRCARKTELLRRLLRGFVDQYCQEPLPDAEPARSAWTHRLKGTAANLGLMRLSRQAAALEAELRGEAPLSGADLLLQALLLQTLTELDGWLAEAG